MSSHATATYQLLAAFADELGRCGLRDACTAPGSRCAPLVLTLARDPRLRCHSHIDERCAGFFALGLAKASGLPVAVTCTSGSAVAELLPAVVEAREARVPLLVLSADRPPELRENGAGQAIDQLKLFGDFAKWFFDVGTHETSGPERVRWMRTLACRAFWTAVEGRPGVVHLNFAFREPLVCDPAPPQVGGGRPAGAPFLARGRARNDSAHDAQALDELVGDARRGLVVAGRHERHEPLGHAAAAFCTAAGWPLLADPMSGARRGVAAIAHYDALLRDASFAQLRRPEVVVRVGDLPVSKPLRSWLASLADVPQVALDPESAWQDPASVVSHSLPAEPAATLNALSFKPRESDPDWLADWRSADERAAEAIRRELDKDCEGLSEPGVALELGVLLPDAATLFVSSSMPVRDIETFWPVRPDPPRVLCNRGANGIDGTVSSAFGAAAFADGPMVLLIGDVALAHDIGGLLAASRLGLKLTIVLLNNAGGAIFDFLPVSRTPMARERNVYTEHIATPPGMDFAHAAALYGCSHERASTLPQLRAALERALSQAQSGIIEVQTERTSNVALHERLWSAVAEALRS